MEGDETRPQARPFTQWLMEQRGGGLHGELSDALAELAAACREHGKAGSLVLTVKVTPNKDGVTVLVTDELKARPPEADPTPSLFFADDRGNLSRRDPRQLDLPLRKVGEDDDEREAASQ